jgi:hypothetical protein
MQLKNDIHHIFQIAQTEYKPQIAYLRAWLFSRANFEIRDQDIVD